MGALDGFMGGGSDPYAGLLTPEMQRSVQQRQLLGLAQGLLQAGAPSRMPVGFGQALGQGLQGMQQGRDQGLNDAFQPLILQAQLKKLQAADWAETKDAFGNPIAYNKTNPNQTVPIGNSGGMFGAPNPSAAPSQTAAPNPGEYGPAQPQATPNQSVPQNKLSGDEFLKTLPPQAALQVKALSEGRMPFPSGFALKSPYWQQMVSAVSQYDPTFDAVNYNARAKTRGSFVSGPDANNITALNTAMNHASSLKDAYDNLGNGDYPSINTAKNWLGNAFGDQTTQTNTAAVGARGHALSGELAKVFRSTGMAESDIKAWENKLSTSATPAQSKETLNSAMDLMEGRLQALASKYNQGMGTTKSGIELLSPEAQKAYAKVRGTNPGSVTAGQSPQSQNQLGNAISYQEYFK